MRGGVYACGRGLDSLAEAVTAAIARICGHGFWSISELPSFVVSGGPFSDAPADGPPAKGREFASVFFL